MGLYGMDQEREISDSTSQSLLNVANHRMLRISPPPPQLLLEAAPPDITLPLEKLTLKDEPMDNEPSIGPLSEEDYDFLSASTLTLFSASLLSVAQDRHSAAVSETDEETCYPDHKGTITSQYHYIDEERKWLRYKVDSMTREQAVVLCVLGQILLSQDEICGCRHDVPSPDDAKQILIVMAMGDHWDLRNLSLVMSFSDKINNIITSWRGIMNIEDVTRQYLETLIMNQLDLVKTEYQHY